MAQSINEIYLFVQDLVNKNQNGYLPPDEFNRLINQAQFSRFNELYGKPEQYAGPNAPFAKMGYARTQELSEKLAPFVVDDLIALVDGACAVPIDLEHAVSMSANDKTVKRVELDRLYNYLNSTVNVPTETYPIYAQVGEAYNIYPVTISTIRLKYLRLPAEAQWAYTNIGDTPVYDPTNSTDLEWDTTETNNIVFKLLSMFGISVKDGQMIGYAEQQKGQGN